MLTYAQAVAQFDNDGTLADVSTVYPAALKLPYIYLVEWVTPAGDEESEFVETAADADALLTARWPDNDDCTLEIYTLRDLLTGVL